MTNFKNNILTLVVKRFDSLLNRASTATIDYRTGTDLSELVGL